MAKLQDSRSIIYDAVELWKRECLLANGSVFGAGAIWTRENAGQLVEHFIERPDEGSRTFEEKLHDQLEPATPAAKRLAAEMLWVMMLFPSNIKRDRKTKLVQTVWSWSGETLPDSSQAFSAFEYGIGSAGMGYNNFRPWEMNLLIRFTGAWKNLSMEEQGQLLDDPWRFADWFDRLPDATSRQLRHMLFHLLFPDHFERISSTNDKKRVDSRFASLIQDDSVDVQDRGPSAIARDRRLFLIRQRLEAERPGQWLDFYETKDIAARWREDRSSADPGVSNGRVSEQSPSIAARGPRTWVMSAGDAAAQWPSFREESLVAIEWDELGDLRQYKTVGDVRTAIKQMYDRDQEPINDGLACYEFCHAMQPGDEIFIKQGLNRILAQGKVSGGYEHDERRPSFRNVRPVEWIVEGNWTLPETFQLPVKTLTDITGYPPLRDAIREQSQSGTPVEQDSKPYGIDDVAREAFLPRSEVERILNALRRRQNVILQGPPGVGKTFLAKRLAYALIGAESSDCVQMVQFHQTYAYEDFIQGWRPAGNRGFELKKGIFYTFCERARAHPREPHVFIIDEINRGNLSKIFGELMLLVESDKRGPSYAIPLTYAESSSDKFFVPANLYILGLMNTADRSLAMVDYALRRRFAFITLAPQFGSERFRQHLLARGVDEPVVEQVVNRVSKLNSVITKDDKNLGPGFVVGHSYFCPTTAIEDANAWYAMVVENEIRPLLEEYWFDNPARIEECVDILSR